MPVPQRKRAPLFPSINDAGLLPSPTKVGPSLPRVPGRKPALTGRALAVTRGKGKKVGLKRLEPIRRREVGSVQPPKIGLPRRDFLDRS